MAELKTIGAKLQGDMAKFLTENREALENDQDMLLALIRIYAALANVQKVDDLYFRDIHDSMKFVEGYSKAAKVWAQDKDIYRAVFYRVCHLYSDLIDELWYVP